MAEGSKRTTVLGKLRGRSLDELRVRGKQFLHTRAERHGLSKLNRIPSDEQLRRLLSIDVPGGAAVDQYVLRHFATRTTPRFFGAFENEQKTRQKLRQRFLSNEAIVVEKSERIAKGRFDLLGLKDLDFGMPPNWHLEPTAATVAPLIHWSRIDYLETNLTGDKKITWELNRQQYFATLGRAYWFTGDEHYAEIFATQLENWIEQNPPKLGINWASSLEVGYRSIAWLWAIYFFKQSPQLTPALFGRVLKLLYLHALHLENYLSTYFSPNTHLTGEALGLFYLGLLLPEFAGAERWRKLGQSILLDELDRHVLADGVYFEQSSYYHRYTVEIYLHLLLLLRANQQSVPEKLERKLLVLLDHLLYITRPDGSSPLFGDDDGGKLIMLDERALDDFRSTLVTGATLFARGDYKEVAGPATEESFWLLGGQSLEQFDRLVPKTPKETSRAFQTGGYYVMRDGWNRSANYMLIDCGRLGGLRFGHAHADVLSYEIAAHGRTLLVDPGTYTYTGSKADRDYFRSSLAHNTIIIDGQSSSVYAGPFSWRSAANAELLTWITRPRFDFFSGRHDGYCRLPNPAIHRRDVLFLKGDYWIIVDEIESSGTHDYQLPFHFIDSAHPLASAEDICHVIRERPQDSAGMEIFVNASAGHWQDESGWVSRAYRQRAPAPVPTLAFRSEGPTQIVTFVFPRKAKQQSVSVGTWQTEEGKAFEVRDGVIRDLLMLGSTRITRQTISDFRLSWLRLGDNSEPREVVLLNGRTLMLDGAQIIGFNEPVGFATAKNSAGELIGETDTVASWRQPFPFEPNKT